MNPPLGWNNPRPPVSPSRERLVTFVMWFFVLVAIVVVIALLVGLGFEFVKWLGHTQK